MTNIFNRLVDYFGGQVATAKALGVTQGTVSGWARGIHGCSADIAFLAQIKTAGQFTAAQLRPSLASSLPTLNSNVRPTSPLGESSDDAGDSYSTGAAR